MMVFFQNDDQKVINQCLENGAKSHISKPFDFQAVLKSVKILLEN